MATIQYTIEEARKRLVDVSSEINYLNDLLTNGTTPPDSIKTFLENELSKRQKEYNALDIGIQNHINNTKIDFTIDDIAE